MNTSYLDAPEDVSDISSQVGSNITIQESSPSQAKEDTTISSQQVSLDLSLTIIPLAAPGTSPTGTSGSTSDPTPQKVFSCNYCHRKFSSSQAMGGHQNAHKMERTLDKHVMRFGRFPYARPCISPFPLGMKAHSTLHHGSHDMIARQEREGVPRFEQSFLRPMPVSDFYWTESSRQVGIRLVAINPLQVDEPDLTLRL